MKSITGILMMIIAMDLYAGGMGPMPMQEPVIPQEKYVCFDGRMVDITPGGYVWYAKRGCFISNQPCCAHQANRYGAYVRPEEMLAGLSQCRKNYPFRLGEMQTH